jgi:hypothetical protein
MDEPCTPNPIPLPCATAHSAPVEWLHACPEPGRGAAAAGEPDPLIDPAEAEAERIGSAIDLILSNPSAIGELIARAAPDDVRADGWTPFCRRLFLQVLAETGRVSTACEYTRLSKQSAYALRARDPLFAAGWDAASELARAPLADALYEKALDGVTDTITKDGEVVAVRHRFDSRLSTAVLARLDRRCDRAEEKGSKHLALVQRWDDVIGMIGRGEDDAALAVLEAGPQSAQHSQASQLPEENSPTEVEEVDLWHRCWKDDDGVWMTDFPPPPGFTGYQTEWNDPDHCYQRECSPEEVELLDRNEAAAEAEERGEDERLRDEWFGLLRAEVEADGRSRRNQAKT